MYSRLSITVYMLNLGIPESRSWDKDLGVGCLFGEDPSELGRSEENKTEQGENPMMGALVSRYCMGT